ncbi:MAG: hypothetical protein HPY44_13220 [Armatimonadetes bacterium]|nr:hypothetical protein [Armatimonadota bacterium]
MDAVKLGFVPSYRNRWTEWTQRMRDESMRALSALPGVEVISPGRLDDSGQAPAGCTQFGAVHDLDEAEIVAAYFAAEGVDAVVVCPTDFGDERSTSKIAEKLGVPLMLYATKEPPASTLPGMARVSDSYCGTLSIAAGLHRRRIPFRFAGVLFPDEPQFAKELGDFAAAVSAVKSLRNARIGQIGVRPPTFETVAYDEVAMARKFGQNVIFANLDDILYEVRGMSDADPQVLEIMAAIRASVPTITVDERYLLNAAKLEAALAGFWSKHGLSALSMQCWPSIQRELGISLCALFGRLTDRHMLTACEADILGALSMLAQYGAALGDSLPHFVDWTIQHRDNPNQLLAWHCGNAPVCLAADPASVALRSRKDMKGELPPDPEDPQAGLYQFQVKPGPVTFCRLAEYDGAWKMLIARGEIQASPETLAGTWAWVEVRDHAALYRTLVEEGFIHHASMIHGDQTEPLRQACQFMDIQPVVVE